MDGPGHRNSPGEDDDISRVEHAGLQGAKAKVDKIGNRPFAGNPIDQVAGASSPNERKSSEKERGETRAVSGEVDDEAQQCDSYNNGEQEVADGFGEAGAQAKKGAVVFAQNEFGKSAQERNGFSGVEPAAGHVLGNLVAADGGGQNEHERNQAEF